MVALLQRTAWCLVLTWVVIRCHSLSAQWKKGGKKKKAKAWRSLFLQKGRVMYKNLDGLIGCAIWCMMGESVFHSVCHKPLKGHF